MLKSVKIEKLRGIRDGALEDLSPLVVLVGPNSAGKSTILDALIIGAGRRPGSALGYAVRRRPDLSHGARWLLWRGADEGEARVTVRSSDDEQRECTLKWSESPLGFQQRILAQRRAPGPYTAIEIAIESSLPFSASASIAFASNNDFTSNDGSDEGLAGGIEAWLVDARSSSYGRPLHDLYSRAAQRGRRQATFDLVSAIVPGLKNIEILTEDETPVLYLGFEDYSVPAALGGDGVQALLRLSFELTSRASGTVLMEEPEAHQHPAAIHQSARAILAGVRRGIQVILTTHSIELLDALVAELKEDELPLLSVYRLKLDAGQLRHTRIAGPDVAFARGEIGDDLR